MQWSGGRATQARLAVIAALFCLMPARGASAGVTPPESSTVEASLSRARARDAYTRGATAYAAGDYERAARELALADALVPDPVTLRAALDAVTLADDAVLGVDLEGRAARSAELDPALAKSLASAHARFAHRTGRIVARCGACVVGIDGQPLPSGESQVVLVGVHLVAVAAEEGSAPETRFVTVHADETREVGMGPGSSAPVLAPGTAAPSPAEGDRSGGLAPAWFVAAAAATVALAGVTVWSGARTVSDHTRFDGAGCATLASSGCAEAAANGQNAQTRTVWLLAASGVAVAGTTALGVFGVRWRKAPARVLTVGVSGPSLSLRLTF